MANDKKDDINLEGIIDPAEALAEQNDTLTNDGLISDDQAREFADEAINEQEFGDQPAKAAGLGALRGLSFGLSDKALTKTGLFSKKELRELEERNRAASLTGEIGGTLAPSLLTGGTAGAAGIAARAARTASTGVRIAEKAGRVTEVLSQKALRRILKSAGSKSAAKKILEKGLAKGIGSTAETAFYTTGQLISEEALGRADINAENLIAGFGNAALIGGTLGGALGTASVISPIIRNGKVKDFVTKKIKNTDANDQAWQLVKKEPLKRQRLKEASKEVYNNSSEFLVKRAGMKVTDNTEKLFAKVNDAVKTTGKEIDDIMTKIEAKASHAIPSRQQFYDNLSLAAQKSKDEIVGSSSKASSMRKAYDKQIARFREATLSKKPLNAIDIRKEKTAFQQSARFNKLNRPADALVSGDIARSISKNIDEIAVAASTDAADLSAALKKANLDYRTGLELLNPLEKKAAGEASKSSLFNLRDLLFTGIGTAATGNLGIGALVLGGKKLLESDVKRRLQILASVERQNAKVNNKITKGIKNFLAPSAAKGKALKKAATIGLVNTSFNLPNPDGSKKKKPKNKQEAFIQIRNDLDRLTSNVDLLTSRLANSQLKVSGVTSNIAEQADQIAIRAVQYLNMKIPKNNNLQGGINSMAREYQPSSLELSKFERILEAVENPMSIIEDLSDGKLTRESAEAVRFIYPNLYLKMQETALQYIAENAETITYEKRLQIGILLDVPADSSLIPENITALQQGFTDEEQQQKAAVKQQSAVQTTQKGIQNMSFSEDAKSQSEKVATRK